MIFIALMILTMSNSCPIGEPLSLPKSTIYYVVDDSIDNIFINKNPLYLQPYEKSFNVGLGQIQLYLMPGDIISFTVSHQNDWGQWTPAFILATIDFFDNKGGNRKFSTSNEWVCDGSNPQILGQNSDFETTNWKNKKMFTQIESNAKLIWNLDHRISSTCSFKIPCY